MLDIFKVILLFKKPDWDENNRGFYIAIGVIAWLEVISLLIGAFI